MPESYQQEYREIAPANAKLWADDANDVEGYVDASDFMLKSDNILTATATASNDFTAGTVGLLVSAGTITLTDADAAATTDGLVVMALGTTAGGASGQFLMPVGTKVTKTGHGFTIGAPLYIGTTTGALVNSGPTTGDFQRAVGYALDANTILFTGGNSKALAL